MLFAGEFTTNVCKNFKIPRKTTNPIPEGTELTPDKSLINDIILRSNPPPPGTTDYPPNDYVSPLAAAYTGISLYPCDQSYNNYYQQFDNQPPPPPPPPLPTATTETITAATTNETSQAPRPGSKRRSIYSKTENRILYTHHHLT